MFNIFGNGNCSQPSSTLLWFIILVILLFMKNGDGCCEMTDDCGC